MIVPRIARYWNRLSFRLPVLIALFAAVTGLVSGGIAYAVAHQTYVSLAKERMELVRNERSRAVLQQIDNYRTGLGSLVTRPGVAEMISAFSNALERLSPDQRKTVIELYT